MPTITIAEALARIDTYRRRMEKKQHLVAAHLLRKACYRDPLQSEGGSAAVLAAERASVRALQERHLLLRRLIQQAYEKARITFGDQTRSLADWLVWRREVATRRAGFLQALSRRIQKARQAALRTEHRRLAATGAGKAVDVIVHLNEQELAEQTEEIEELLGYLEGQLALKNATLTIDIPDEEAAEGWEERLEQLQQAASAFTVFLDGLADPARKIGVIKVLRELTSLGLKEAKDLVEGAPKVVKEDVPRDEASVMKQKLEAAGARVSLSSAPVTKDVPTRRAGVRGQEDRPGQQGQALAPTMLALTPPWSISPELCRLARDPGQKLAAIKLYRELTKVGLREALDAVEAFQAAQLWP